MFMASKAWYYGFYDFLCVCFFPSTVLGRVAGLSNGSPNLEACCGNRRFEPKAFRSWAKRLSHRAITLPLMQEIFCTWLTFAGILSSKEYNSILILISFALKDCCDLMFLNANIATYISRTIFRPPGIDDTASNYQLIITRREEP